MEISVKTSGMTAFLKVFFHCWQPKAIIGNNMWWERTGNVTFKTVQSSWTTISRHIPHDPHISHKILNNNLDEQVQPSSSRHASTDKQTSCEGPEVPRVGDS